MCLVAGLHPDQLGQLWLKGRWGEWGRERGEKEEEERGRGRRIGEDPTVSEMR